MTNSVETPPQIELIGVSSADNDEDNIGAAVVGAVLGSVCGLLLIGIAFFFVSRTRGNTPDSSPHPVLRIGSRINRDRPPSQPPSKGQSAKSSGFKDQADPCRAAGAGLLSWSTQMVPTSSHCGAVAHAERVHSARAEPFIAGHERVMIERQHTTSKSAQNQHCGVLCGVPQYTGPRNSPGRKPCGVRARSTCPG